MTLFNLGKASIISDFLINYKFGQNCMFQTGLEVVMLNPSFSSMVCMAIIWKWPSLILLYWMLCIYPPGIQDLNILNAYTSSMGFLDKLKRSISGGKEKADDAKDAAARAQKTVDDSAERAKRAADDSAERAKRTADKADNAADDVANASDELKKD